MPIKWDSIIQAEPKPFFDKMKEIAIADFETMKAYDDPKNPSPLDWDEEDEKNLVRVRAATNQQEVLEAMRGAAWDFYAAAGTIRAAFKAVPEVDDYEIFDLADALINVPLDSWDT